MEDGDLGTFLVKKSGQRKRFCIGVEIIVMPSIKGSCKREDPTLSAKTGAVVIER